MNKLLKKSMTLVVTLIMVMSLSMVTYAQGTTSISVSNSSIGVGDTTTVSITASSSGKVTVKYTASLMNLIDCSASGYTFEGNVVEFSGTSADLKFKSLAEGTASIIVSSSSCSGSSTTITIGGTATSSDASEEETAEEETTEETAEEETTEETTETTTATTTAATGTLNSDGGFDIDGTAYVVSERYSDSEIPNGFSKITVTIGSSTYNELNNGNITLLYLKPADNTAGSGEFYIYNESAGTVSKLMMLGNSDQYVMIATATDLLSGYMTETTLSTDNGDVTAYTIDGSEFFYVYGFNQDNVVGWFMYDKEYDTVCRADESAFSAGSTDEVTVTEETDDTESTYDATQSYQKRLDRLRVAVSILIVLCVVLLFVLLNGRIKKDSDGDSDDGDIFAKAPAKTSRRMPRSIVFSDSDDEEDEDEDEDEDEEPYDNDEDEDLDDIEEKTNSTRNSKSKSSGLDMIDFNDL